jgi:hypothetical protein
MAGVISREQSPFLKFRIIQDFVFRFFIPIRATSLFVGFYVCRKKCKLHNSTDDNCRSGAGGGVVVAAA